MQQPAGVLTGYIVQLQYNIEETGISEPFMSVVKYHNRAALFLCIK